MAFKARAHGIVEQALTRNSSLDSGWLKVRAGEGFSFWFIMVAAGAPSVSLYVDYSPFEQDGEDTDPSTSGRTNYVTSTLGTGITTKDVLVQYACPTALKSPFVNIRLRVVEADVAAATSVTFAFCRNTEG